MKKFELSIPKPCHENWDAMSPEDKGRFCGACQKTVIDFTDMSDRQVAEFFKKPAGNVCGRFGGEQLDRVIEVPRKRIPWVKHFFTIALPAFLFSIKAGAQGEVRVKGKVAVCEKPIKKPDTISNPVPVSLSNALEGRLGMVLQKPVEQPIQDFFTIVSGHVSDENGNPLQAASIHLLTTQEGTTTDNLGNFSLKVKLNSEVIQITYVGFENRQISFKGKSFFTVAMTADKRELMGELIVVPIKKKKPVPLIPLKQADTAFSKFSVFPNPIERNSVVTIEAKAIEDGRYNMSIMTSTGEVVQTKELVIENKLKRITVQLENIAAAPYFIRLTNKANNKVYTEILLVK